MPYTHLAQGKHYQIGALYQQDLPQKMIAEKLEPLPSPPVDKSDLTAVIVLTAQNGFIVTRVAACLQHPANCHIDVALKISKYEE